MPTRREILIGALAVAVLAISIYALSQIDKAPAADTTPAAEVVKPIPPYTEEIAAQLATSKGFQLLVSYTDNGFEPATGTIKKGETVRFTNNSSGDLWLAASGEKLYPSVVNGCGSSALDTCKALKPQEFWEFTFAAAGTWGYHNNSDTGKVGTIRVQ